MQIKKLLVIGLLVIAVGGFLHQKQAVKLVAPQQEEKLTIVSTKPNPLDETTILPKDGIEITFNYPIYRSELKHRFDPEIEHEVEAVNGVDKELGTTFKITFNEPLELGRGYTLFILSNTHDQKNHSIDHEYTYHFKTISYRGV